MGFSLISAASLRRIARVICIAAVTSVLLASCGPKALDSRGEVNLWIPREMTELREAAGALDGLSLSVVVAGESWITRLKLQKEPPDLMYTNYDRDIVEGIKSGLLLDLSPYFDRMPVTEKMLTAFAHQSEANTGMKYIVPAAAYTWGLFYNKTVLASHGIQIPESWDEWLDALKVLKSKGVVPIALGTSIGWPALAWVSYLDLRLNGGAAHLKLLEGARSFDDPSMVAVYTTLEEWRDAGYFNADASTINWRASLELVGSGQAAFVLMGAFSESRIPNRDEIKFAPVPTAGNEGDRGELAVIEGFAVAASARAPEAALSLAEKYLPMNLPRSARGGYLMSVLETEEGVAPQQGGVAAVQLEIFESADVLVPQLDRYFPAQAAYDFARVLARFFDPNTQMSADDLARILKNIRP